MTAFEVIVVVAGVAAVVCSGIRFLRVAQREHYLPGAPLRFFFRWWNASAPARAQIVLACACAIAALVYPPVGLGTAVICALGPPGLSLRGRTAPLAWTRRLRLLASVAVALVAALLLGLGLSLGLRAAACAAVFAALGTVLVLEGALVLCGPLEERLAARFVARARQRVERVAPRIVAITGSYGKTSTKNYLAHLLEERFALVASPRSYNNRAGLARTVNELLVPGTEVFVAEMGTYGPGEIAALCAWLPPDIAVITAIGPVHLERFKQLERTLAAKAEITERARVVVLNTDDERLAGLARELARTERQIWRCSAQDKDVDVAVIPEDGGLAIYSRGRHLGVFAPPADAAVAPTNLACAFGVALALELTPLELLARAATLGAVESRLTTSRSAAGVVVLDDTFNSNPVGARRALARLADLGSASGRRVVITPGMVELGPVQVEENAALGRDAAAVATDVLVVGATNRKALLAGIDSAPGGSARAALFAHREEAVAWVRAELGEGDVVLYENDLPDHYP